MKRSFGDDHNDNFWSWWRRIEAQLGSIYQSLLDLQHGRQVRFCSFIWSKKQPRRHRNSMRREEKQAHIFSPTYFIRSDCQSQGSNSMHSGILMWWWRFEQTADGLLGFAEKYPLRRSDGRRKIPCWYQGSKVSLVGDHGKGGKKTNKKPTHTGYNRDLGNCLSGRTSHLTLKEADMLHAAQKHSVTTLVGRRRQQGGHWRTETVERKVTLNVCR